MLRKSNNLSVSLSVRIVAYHVVTTRQLWQPEECVIQASVTNTMTMVYFFTLTTEPECDEVKRPRDVWRPKCFFLGLDCMEAAMLEKVWWQQCSSKTYADGRSGMQTEMTKIQNKCYDIDWRWGWDEKRYGLQMLWGWLKMRVYELKEFEWMHQHLLSGARWLWAGSTNQIGS